MLKTLETTLEDNYKDFDLSKIDLTIEGLDDLEFREQDDDKDNLRLELVMKNMTRFYKELEEIRIEYENYYGNPTRMPLKKRIEFARDITKRVTFSLPAYQSFVYARAGLEYAKMMSDFDTTGSRAVANHQILQTHAYLSNISLMNEYVDLFNNLLDSHNKGADVHDRFAYTFSQFTDGFKFILARVRFEYNSLVDKE